MLRLHCGGSAANPQHDPQGQEQARPEPGHRRAGLEGVLRHSEVQGCKCRHSLRRRSPGRYVAGLLALRYTGTESAFRASPPLRRMRPRAGSRPKRGQERAVSRPAHLRIGRGSGWDGAWRSRGFRSTLTEGAEDLRIARARCAGCSRKRNRSVQARPSELEYCKSLRQSEPKRRPWRFTSGTGLIEPSRGSAQLPVRPSAEGEYSQSDPPRTRGHRDCRKSYPPRIAFLSARQVGSQRFEMFRNQFDETAASQSAILAHSS